MNEQNQVIKTKKIKKTKYIVLIILLLIISIFSFSYAVLNERLIGEKKYTLTIGTLDFKLDNETNAIRLMNAYPMSDTEGQALIPYTFTLTNTGTIKEYYKISLVTDTEQQATCSGCEFLSPSMLRYSVTIDGVAGEAKTVADQTVLEIGELTANQSKNYELRLWLSSEATVEEENKYYFGKIKVDASQEEIKETFAFGGVSFPVEKTTDTFPDFAAISSETNGRGIYKYQEDGEDIYYWRGAVTDNHVIFGGYCWEMVRTTKTGGIKMIYDGTPVESNGVQTCPNTGSNSQLSVGNIKFNASYNDNAYVGYMYGLTGVTAEPASAQCIKLNSAGTQAEVGVETTKEACEQAGGKWATTAYESTHANVVNSNIKGEIDKWFSTSSLNTEENLEKIEDAVYCNDRRIDTTYETALGYGTNVTGYMARNRFYTNKTTSIPDLSCSKNDSFTVNVENGNGDLTYPVGLLTADEISLAGGVFVTSNSDYYLYTGQYYWALSPSNFYGSYAYGFRVGTDGTLSNYDVNYTYGVRPVVSLAAGTTFASGGAGTESAPYVAQ